VITSPTPGSTLTSASTTFTWNTDSSGVISYGLNVGTSPGGADLVNIGPLSGPSVTVNLPTNGTLIFVRLWTILDGTTYLYNDYTYTEFAQPATMTSPSNGSTLTSASTTFTWNAALGSVTGYGLNVGTSPGGADLVNIGPLSGTSTTVNLPTNGTKIFVRLWTILNGTTYFYNDYTYTEFAQPATMTSPSNGSTLTSASTTFTWNAALGSVTGYGLNVGTTGVGSADLVNIGPLSGTSATVTLPTNGATIYVRLWTVFNGTTYFYNDYTYTEFAHSAAAITSPVPGSTLTSASTTFTWNAALGSVTGYGLNVGTTGVGSADLVNIGPLSGTSATVTLPTNGATIYVRLWTVFNGTTYFYNDYTYTEFAHSVAAITSPVPGSTLTSASTTFTWNAALGSVTGYGLNVGTTGVGSADLVNIGPLSGTSATVTLPTNGATIYVRLWTIFNGTTYFYNDYTYTEFAHSVAAITSPVPGSTLTSASTTFTWNAALGSVTGYGLNVGTTGVGSADLVNIGPLSGTSATVTLPTNGATIYVRLWTIFNGTTYFYNDYTYSAASSSPTLSTSATTIAFGTVNLNSPATQSLILTATGSAAVTVSAAIVAGSGFTVSGGSFPVTLNPNQTASLSVQFDPTVAGAATGQLSITSNSSTGSSVVVSLSGMGAAVPYEVNLNWDAPTSSPDPVVGYNVYRAPSGSTNYQQLNSAAVTGTAYVDTTVLNNQTYDYIVESVDASGVTSSPSNMAAIPVP
jgi:hypothetical protein